jgi:hypothetical protein
LIDYQQYNESKTFFFSLVARHEYQLISALDYNPLNHSFKKQAPYELTRKKEHQNVAREMCFLDGYGQEIPGAIRISN